MLYGIPSAEPPDLMRASTLAAVFQRGFLRGRRVFVTGVGAKTVPMQIARMLKEIGEAEQLFIHAAPGELAAAESALAAVGVNCEGEEADFADTDAAVAVARQALEQLERIDIFVHGAGLTAYYDRHTLTVAEYQRVYNIKYLAYLMMNNQIIMPHMLERDFEAHGRGKNIVLSSVHSGRIMEGVAAGTAPEDGMRGTSEAYADANRVVCDEVKRQALRLRRAGNVNALQLGHIANQRHFALPHEIAGMEGSVANLPVGGVAHPEDPAGVVGFLCSPLGDFMTGQTLVFDGGFSCEIA